MQRQIDAVLKRINPKIHYKKKIRFAEFYNLRRADTDWLSRSGKYEKKGSNLMST